jgi:uncharacterized membrane protein
MWTWVTIAIVVVVVVLVVGWFGRGKKSKPQAGPTVADLGTAEDMVRIEEMRQRGEISDEEYHAAKAKLLS